MPQFRVTGTLRFTDGSGPADFDSVEFAADAQTAIAKVIDRAKKMPSVDLVDNVTAVLYGTQEDGTAVE